MKKLLTITLTITILVLAGFAAAQQNRGINQGSGPAAEGIPVETLQVSGPVTEVNLGIGQGSPSIIVDDKNLGPIELILAPYFVLEGFGVQVDQETIVEEAIVFESKVYDGLFVTLSLVIDGQTYVLRNELGQPVWAGGRNRGAGQGGRGCCDGNGPGISPEEIKPYTGLQVASVDASFGQGFPTITTADGLQIMISPNRSWANAPFQVVAGDVIDVKAFPSLIHEGYLVAAQITKNGETVTLRDDSGMPLRQGRGKGSCLQDPTLSGSGAGKRQGSPGRQDN